MSQGSPNSMIPDMSPLEHLVDQDVTPRQVCGVLAKMFQVQQTEVAILRLDRGLLHFIFPEELRTAGSIPISSSSIAAHTAISKKSEIFNNFARVKHASVFETVKLGTAEGMDTSEPLPIQKLMSAPDDPTSEPVMLLSDPLCPRKPSRPTPRGVSPVTSSSAVTRSISRGQFQ